MLHSAFISSLFVCCLFSLYLPPSPSFSEFIYLLRAFQAFTTQLNFPTSLLHPPPLHTPPPQYGCRGNRGLLSWSGTQCKWLRIGSKVHLWVCARMREKENGQIHLHANVAAGNLMLYQMLWCMKPKGQQCSGMFSRLSNEMASKVGLSFVIT